MKFGQRTRSALERLYTGYFASVMATGIVSTALKLAGNRMASAILLVVSILIYVVLVVAYLLRCFWFPTQVKNDLTNAAKVFGYFTFVAASNVLGDGLIEYGYAKVALWLEIVAIIVWTALVYHIMMYLIFYNRESVEKVINGSWLIATVGIESVAVVGTALAESFPRYSSLLSMVSIATWEFGAILYLIFIGIVMCRFFFYSITASDLSPPYWINMGAVAITSLAGARITLLAHPSNFLQTVRPLVEGFTFLLWVWGSWWIPLLILIGIWKYVVFREKIRYEPALWTIVFPLGMFTVATETMSKIPGLGAMHAIVPWGLGVAVIAWSLVAIGWCKSWFHRLASGQNTSVSDPSQYYVD
ncbi:MAG: tellurite resistance/C4-dicarboxylate transporter family protein [Alicyclobacillus herbarius]|uniref:tellurite resistance/C4-dicarboxylate transporter family protein n=1 Tax=Alicyclobacillus herbarius TaxID=122960 RepID=UPI0023552AE2|nr:tellurite resistance/C4-dicarboxylate transporter family protein [Alicyclobacillus herbarius]MCL6634085.1 tellurite resistance/C4-dicarboxylate transporter family protein [Alicyclobacillus herbarius]